ncbi:MAG TPA: YlxR family protein [Candidatus Binataceae bacterium]|nr:YlxR family protein [Candidatus Binataceae bacterium]
MTSRRNHKPVRSCLGCNSRDLQSTLVRVTIVDGALVLDEPRERGGRGGYLHRDAGCLQKFVRSRVKEFRALRRGIPRDERSRITELLQVAAG